MPETLKSIITDDKLIINLKHQKPITIKNSINVMLTTNVNIPIEIEKDDRRMAIFDTISQKLEEGMSSRKYFDELFKETKHSLYYYNLYKYFYNSYEAKYDLLNLIETNARRRCYKNNYNYRLDNSLDNEVFSGNNNDNISPNP